MFMFKRSVAVTIIPHDRRNDMGENAPLGFHPEIEQDKLTHRFTAKSEKRAGFTSVEIDSILPGKQA